MLQLKRNQGEWVVIDGDIWISWRLRTPEDGHEGTYLVIQAPRERSILRAELTGQLRPPSLREAAE